MNPIKRGRATRLSIAALGAVGALAIFAGVASAVSGTATLTAGTLAIANPSSVSFTGTLSGSTDYFKDTTHSLEVVNPGGASGWNVTAIFDDFTCTTASTCSTNKLTNLSINGDTSSATASTSPSDSCTASPCVAPTLSSMTYPATVPDTGSPAKIYNAAAKTGVGQITAATTWWLTTPADTVEGSYSSTITLAINSGP